MITTISGDLFKAALRKCGGILAEGETPSAELLEDTRLAFNMMVDAWSAERLSVYGELEQVLTWPAGMASRTVGPSGDIVGTRPMGPVSAFFRISAVDYPLTPITSSIYDEIPQKTTSSSHPEFIYIDQEVPNATIYLYPVPSGDLELHLSSVQELAQIPDLFTNILLPPGYQKALIYNLAVEMCPELGMEVPPTVKRIAIFSKRALRAHNSPKDILQVPSALSGGNRFNIFVGE
jgi:hypothetical protein